MACSSSVTPTALAGMVTLANPSGLTLWTQSLAVGGSRTIASAVSEWAPLTLGQLFETFPVATAWMLHAMTARAMAPAALLLNFANPIMAQGAALAGLPLVDRFEADVTAAIRSGDQVTVEPASGRVTVARPG